MEPITRSEQFLAAILGEDVVLPIPQSRIEHYLSLIAQNGIAPSSAGLINYDPDASYPDGSIGKEMHTLDGDVSQLKSQITDLAYLNYLVEGINTSKGLIPFTAEKNDILVVSTADNETFHATDQIKFYDKNGTYLDFWTLAPAYGKFREFTYSLNTKAYFISIQSGSSTEYDYNVVNKSSRGYEQESEIVDIDSRLGEMELSDNLWSMIPDDWQNGTIYGAAGYAVIMKKSFPIAGDWITWLTDVSTLPEDMPSAARLQIRLLDNSDTVVSTLAVALYNEWRYVDIKTGYPTATKIRIEVSSGVGSYGLTPQSISKISLWVGFAQKGSYITTKLPAIPHKVPQYARQTVDGGYLPEYWKVYMENKKEVIDAKNEAIGANGVSFSFITDTHWNSNYMHSPNLLRWIREHSAVQRVICGGDIINSYSTVKEAMYWLRGWRDRTLGLQMRSVRGNHDDNSVGKTSDLWLGDGRFYASLLRPVEPFVTIEDGHTYYYEKIEAQKVCIFYLDTGTMTTTPIVDFDAQITWMGSIVATLDSDWSILVVQHIVYDGKNPDDSPKVYTYGQKTMDYLDTVTNCTVIGIISGHTHYDYDATAEAGYKIICTRCDAAIGEAQSVMTEGTTTEQAFDVFNIDTENHVIYATRIGYGEDRQFSYGS